MQIDEDKCNMKIIDPTIAKLPYSNINKVIVPVDYERWIEFMNHKFDYFTWVEDTDEGKDTVLNIDKVPESFRERVLKEHDKRKAYAEFNEKKGYYELIVQFNDKFGIVHTTFMKPITKDHLKILLNMANYLDTYLLNNGTEIIDEKVLESLK